MYYCTVDYKHIFRWIEPRHDIIHRDWDLCIANYKFAFNENYQLYVYDGSDLMTLAEAYEQGLLNDEDIGVIYYYHRGSRIAG